MADPTARFQLLKEKFRLLLAQGYVADLVINEVDETIQVRAVGEAARGEMIEEHGQDGITYEPSNVQGYYFFQSPQPQPLPELRPGSGIIRVFGGRREGSGGTLTCFLSSKDGRDDYFVAAGHVLSNFWDEDDIAEMRREEGPEASIYRYQRGFPATNSTLFLGKLTYLSNELKPVNRGPDQELTLDIGIVKIRGGVKPVQRTTCYGSFGEWPDEEGYPPEKTPAGLPVMKCGAEETHWTHAVVESDGREVSIYGPRGLRYKLHKQVILRLEHEKLLESTDPPSDWSAKRHQDSQTPFALPGDSGTMVVERHSKRPVGMLIAGSVLDGRYVMTPFKTIHDFWQQKYDLVLRRG